MTTLRVRIEGRIPRRIMENHYPLYESVPKVFLAALVQKYLEQIYDSYTARSVLSDIPNMDPKGEPVISEEDEDGNTWTQLRPKTYRTKQKQFESGSSQDYLRERLNEYSGNQAAEVLSRFVDTVQPISGDNINIRTGELLAAFFPPPLIDGELVPGPNQICKHTGGTNFSFRTTLEEKEDTVEKFGRPIIPDQYTKELWLERSIELAINEAETEFQRLMMEYGHTYRGQKRTIK